MILCRISIAPKTLMKLGRSSSNMDGGPIFSFEVVKKVMHFIKRATGHNDLIPYLLLLLLLLWLLWLLLLFL